MQKERMLAGKLYTCITEEKQLADMRVRKNRFPDRFNGTAFEDSHIFLWTLFIKYCYTTKFNFSFQKGFDGYCDYFLADCFICE